MLGEPTPKSAEYMALGWMMDVQDHSKNTGVLHALLILYCLLAGGFQPCAEILSNEGAGHMYT